MNHWEVRGSGSWSCGGRFGSSKLKKKEHKMNRKRSFFFFNTTTSCCSQWSPASCLSLCRWTSCGSCVWTRARVPLSPFRPRFPSRLSRFRWRPRPCHPSCDPSGLQTSTQIPTLRWGTTRPQIRSPAAGWRHQRCAGHCGCPLWSSTPLAQLLGSHFSPQPVILAHGCCC